MSPLKLLGQLSTPALYIKLLLMVLACRATPYIKGICVKSDLNKRFLNRNSKLI